MVNIRIYTVKLWRVLMIKDTQQVQSMLSFQRKIHHTISDILKPLFNSFAITYFGHERVFNDGSKAIISSNAELTEYWLRQQYPLDIVLETGCYFGDKLGNIYSKKQQEELSQQFNIAHPLFIIKKYSTHIDGFMIASSVDNELIIHAYLTHIEKIKNFIHYYLLKCHNLIKQAEANKIKMNNIPNIDLPANFIPINPLTDLLHGNYFINKDLGVISLTKRELTCIAWLIKGKSASDIGLILKISKRTVETYINNIKNKFNCTKTTELAYIIGRSNINFPDFDF